MKLLNRVRMTGFHWLGALSLAHVGLALVLGSASAMDVRDPAELHGSADWHVEILADGTLMSLDGNGQSASPISSPIPEASPPKARADFAGLETHRSRTDPLSCGFVPHIVEQGSIQLPVDNWHEAHAIAAAWLDAVGDPSLRLGKMRQLGAAYVLTVLDRSDESLLRHQIVIGAHDGRVAVL